MRPIKIFGQSLIRNLILAVSRGAADAVSALLVSLVLALDLAGMKVGIIGALFGVIAVVTTLGEVQLTGHGTRHDCAGGRQALGAIGGLVPTVVLHWQDMTLGRASFERRCLRD